VREKIQRIGSCYTHIIYDLTALVLPVCAVADNDHPLWEGFESHRQGRRTVFPTPRTVEKTFGGKHPMANRDNKVAGGTLDIIDGTLIFSTTGCG
jgi:hypothetical protein